METFKYYTVDFFDKYGDPRVTQPLMRTPWPIVGMCLLYLSFVKVIGPRIMEHRKPYELKSFIRLYNLLMVLWNAYGIYAWIKYLNWGLDVWGCRPIDSNDRSEQAMRLITIGYVFLISRIVEFVDTTCFVLRKKYRQVSGFHVFHHFTVPIAVWVFVKFAPGGNSGIFPVLNTVIHTVMYGYYFLATYPSLHPYLGWKKYLTQMQIVQFIIMIIHSAQPLFLRECNFPKAFLYTNIFFSCVFIYLFTKFYIANYGKQTVQVARRLSRRFSHQIHSGVRRLSQMSTLPLLESELSEFTQSADTIQCTRNRNRLSSKESISENSHESGSNKQKSA